MFRISILTLLIFNLAPAKSSAQDKDEIITKYIEARGGIEKINSIKSLVMRGVLHGSQVTYPIKFICVAGEAFKVEMQANDTIAFQVVNHTSGWTYFPDEAESKPQPMKEQDVKEAQDYLDLAGPLIDYQKKGYSVIYKGKEKVDTLTCYTLLVSKPGNATVTYYLDEQYQIYQIVKQSKDATLEPEVTTYSNYKHVPGGPLFAFRWTVPDGYVAIDTIEINVAINDLIFRVK